MKSLLSNTMIPVSEPIISSRAKRYVNDCLTSGWISSNGEYIQQFEKRFAEYIGCKYAITTTSGTTALHLALAAIGIQKGDEVIVPDLTIISCAFAVQYLGATPVLVDVEYDTATIDPKKLEAVITPRTKAIMVVHLYGNPADMESIRAIAAKYKLAIIEDAAESLSVTHNKRQVGSLGTAGIFSFYANKLITTGEGGIIVTNDTNVYERACSLRNLAHSKSKRFFHEQIGFNYRMTNIQAAIGLASLEEIDNNIKKKNHIDSLYREYLYKVPFLEIPPQHVYGKSRCWMFNFLIAKNAPFKRDEFMQYLQDNGIETRTYFYPLHKQPVLKNSYKQKFPNSSDLSERGLYIPSGLALTDIKIKRVATYITKFCKSF